tara:strand:+ start:188 stop:364 length:177 start_codon:yes stop_codon:yes gene_type:complete
VATRFGAKSAALAITDNRNPYSKFAAKAQAPNHQKTTDALAYNASQHARLRNGGEAAM